MVEQATSNCEDIEPDKLDFLIKVLGFKGIYFQSLPIQVKWMSMAENIRNLENCQIAADESLSSQKENLPPVMGDLVEFLEDSPLGRVTLSELALILEKKDMRTFRQVCDKYKIKIHEFPNKDGFPSSTGTIEPVREVFDNTSSVESRLDTEVEQIFSDTDKKKNPKYPPTPGYGKRLQVKTSYEQSDGILDKRKERVKNVAFALFETEGGRFRYESLRDIASAIYKDNLAEQNGHLDEYLDECVVKINQDRTSIFNQMEKIFSMPGWLNSELADDFLQNFYKSLRDHELYMDLDFDTLKNIAMRKISFEKICELQNISNISSLPDFNPS